MLAKLLIQSLIHLRLQYDPGGTAGPEEDHGNLQQHHTIRPCLQRLQQNHRAHPKSMCDREVFQAVRQGHPGSPGPCVP